MDIAEVISNLKMTAADIQDTIAALEQLQPCLDNQATKALFAELSKLNGKPKARRTYKRREKAAPTDRSAAGCQTTLTAEHLANKAAEGTHENPIGPPRTRKPRADRGRPRGPRTPKPEEKSEETASAAT